MGHKPHVRSSSTFTCNRCGHSAAGESYGTRQRNHCPACLWSLHLDETPGDRRSPCHALMEPIAVWVKRDGEWALVHRCTGCGKLRTNRVAGDDSPWAMLVLAARPLTLPPFPLSL